MNSNPLNQTSRMLSDTVAPERFPYAASSLVLILLSYSIVFLFSIEEVKNLAREDHIVEYFGATFFLLASVLFFVLYKKSRRFSGEQNSPLKGNVFFLLLGIAFLFVCLEEISWGQRIIGFQTPEGIREMNAQSEFNIHNLQVFHGKTESGDRKAFWALLLNMDRLFSMFWFSFCCLIPVLFRFSTPVRSILERIRMPIVPGFLAGIFLFNYVATKILEASIDSRLHHSTVEIKESNIAFLFFVLAVWFLRVAASKKQIT